MSTETRATGPCTTTDLPSGSDQREIALVEPVAGPVARLVALSLAAGIAAAAVLVTVAFPGASESTVTASVLVAFGLGWALLAWSTTRYTTRPLRWATVPAVSMLVTGAALGTFAPQDDALRTLSWVWPVPTVVLAGYVWARARRTVPRRGRWMLTGVAATLVLAAVGATYENVSVVRDQDTYAAPGRSYEVNGHELYLDCRGHGSPTVVLANGLGEVAASWARIVDQVDPDTRVCAYDRAGQGWSTDDAEPQDGLDAARDLHALLQVAGEHGPYVLVGHSTGGAYALTYTARYPQEVAGMVLLDSASPLQFTALPAYRGQYAVMRRGLALLPTLDRFGLGRVAAAVLPSHLPRPDADVVASLTASAHGARNGRDEVSVLPRLFAQAQALTTLDGRPLAVLTSSENQRETTGWSDAQEQLAALSTNTIHRVVDSTHAGLLEDERPAQESVDAIARVVAAVRTGTAPTTR